MIQTGKRIFAHRATRDFIGDKRITVAVAANPGAKLKEWRNVKSFIRVMTLQRAFKRRKQLRR